MHPRIRRTAHPKTPTDPRADNLHADGLTQRAIRSGIEWSSSSDPSHSPDTANALTSPVRVTRRFANTTERGLAATEMLTEMMLCEELFHTPTGVAFADFIAEGHRETWPIRSKRPRRALKPREASVTHSTNSMISAMLPLSAPYSRYLSLAAALLFLAVTVASGGHASAAADETEARALFTKFVAAQNAHNAGAVKAILWRSPLVSRNTTKAHGISNPTCRNFA